MCYLIRPETSAGKIVEAITDTPHQIYPAQFKMPGRDRLLKRSCVVNCAKYVQHDSDHLVLYEPCRRVGKWNTCKG